MRKSNLILIGFSILCHMSYLTFNFVPHELLSVKIKEFKSNPSKFFIFLVSKILGAKIEEF